MSEQASVHYESPEPFEEWPKFATTAELVAWLRVRYVDYPKWLDLVLLGAVDFGAIGHAQGALQ